MSIPDSFLDLSGLKKYTKKLLKAIQDAVVTYAAGDGVSIEDETINVDNPMRGIITQAEFDALSDEEKSKGTYVISDPFAYDATEVVVGTRNEKLLYRKVIQVTSPTTIKVQQVLYTFPVVPDFLMFYGSLRCENGDVFDINTSSWEGKMIVTFYRSSSNSLLMTVQASEYCGRPVSIILEYTKNIEATSAVSDFSVTTVTDDTVLEGMDTL